MCLNNSIDVTKPGVGWKVVRKMKDCFQGTTQGFILKNKIFNYSSRGKIKDNKGNFYPAGFHIFLMKKDADKHKRSRFSGLAYIVIKVEFRGVVAFGLGEGFAPGLQVIARRMKVIG